jgi:hypothetical protein
MLISSLIFLSSQGTAMAAPAIELSPSEGPAGTMVTVSGSGFIPLSPITITFDGGNMDTRPDTIGTDALGHFSASFEVPHSIDEGLYTVVAKDHSLLRTSASATFNIPEPNNPPSAESQSVSTDRNEAVEIMLGGSDPDDDELTFFIIDSPQHGTVNNLDPASGSLTYIPEQDYDGNDRFTFKVSDGEAESFLAAVSIRVLASSGGPRMEDMQAELEEDTDTVISLSASGADSSSFAFQIVNPPMHGTLGDIKPYDSNSAYVTYTPHANFNGTDSFTAKASDTRYESETATITIIVRPVQDNPVAHDAQATTNQDQALLITLTSSDPDGDTLTYVLETRPTHGTITGSGPNLTYLPSNDYRGWDAFTFKVNDGTADSNIARIEIKVEEVASEDDDSSRNDGGSNSGNSPGTVEPDQTEEEVPPPVPVMDPVPEQAPPPVVENPIPVQEPMPAEEIADGADSPPVADATPPRLIFPASNLVFDSQSEVGMTVTYNIAALDDIDGEVTPECSPPSGAKFPIGKVNVICTATDAAGNTILGSFILEVRLIPNSTVDTNVFELPPLDLQSMAIPSIIAGAAGVAIYVGVKASKKTRAKSSQPQKSV